MAYGQRGTILAPPQPGTSNSPVPAPPLPAFVPVVANVTTTIALDIAAFTSEIQIAIAERTVAIVGLPGEPGTLYAINNTLANCTDFTAGITVRAKMLTKACRDLEKAATAYTAAVQITNQLLAMKTATTVKTNEFTVALSDEKPTLPSTFVQLKDSIAEGELHAGIARVSGAITGSINSIVTGAGSMIANTDTYKTIAGWVSSSIDVIEKAILPSSVYTSLKKSSSQSATPDTK